MVDLATPAFHEGDQRLADLSDSIVDQVVCYMLSHRDVALHIGQYVSNCPSAWYNIPACVTL